MRILSSIKKQLVDGKVPTLSQRQYLIDVINDIEEGIPAEIAIENTRVITFERGKKSIQYQEAKHSRDAQLARAVLLLEGSEYKRCHDLALIGVKMRQQQKFGRVTPKNEVERIILQLLKNGHTIPTTGRQIQEELFMKK